MIGARLAEAGLVPDALVRVGIRRMLRKRLAEAAPPEPELRRARTEGFYRACRSAPVALAPEAANAQHYEVPPAFFERVLGPRLKYSCCLFPSPETSLEEAEEAMLRTTLERAGVADGMSVLDLGCGWGSTALFAAERLPAARILAVSNSKLQTDWIRRRCAERGIGNVRVSTADVNDFEPGERFDRVVSVEMFEHVRNHGLLLRRIRRWLTPEGRLFVHHFCHREVAYPYEVRGRGDWMARSFFTGGMMPSRDLLGRFPEVFRIERQWDVGGVHYHRTCEAWLARQDARRREVLAALGQGGGGSVSARRWFQRWRLFFLGCSELFRYRNGGEWFVTQALLAPAGGLR